MTFTAENVVRVLCGECCLASEACLPAGAAWPLR
jgi:hypothetical protein